MAADLSFSNGTEECKTDQGGHFRAQEGLEAPQQFCAEICTGNKQSCCCHRPVGVDTGEDLSSCFVWCTQMLMAAVKKYREKDWYKVRTEVPGRSDAQCRER